nr:putative ribonuclease h protein [Quercus suber]
MASSFIDENSKWWKPDLVKALFLQFEGNEILTIPLSCSFPEDSLIWLGNRNDSFSVKSAYYVAKDLVESEAKGASSSSHLASPFWRKIWQVNVPPKVKIFAWRVCLDGLPTMLNLRRRGLNTAGFCQICDKELESISHALFHCNHAKQTWSCWSDCPVNLYSPTRDFIGITSRVNPL